ncbi:endonuclease domain-containing protein [Streptomyces tricolor]
MQRCKAYGAGWVCGRTPNEVTFASSEYCTGHYKQKWEGKPFTPIREAGRSKGKCTASGDDWRCEREVVSRKLCNAHYIQKYRSKKPFIVFKPARKKASRGTSCSLGWCRRPSASVEGLCGPHWTQRYRVQELRPLVTRRTKAELRAIEESGEAECVMCNKVHPLEEFHRNQGAYRSTGRYCSSCRAAKARAARFGVQPAFFVALFEVQGGVCAVCRTDTPGHYDWHVDHDHSCCPMGGRSCGRCIRGLVCAACNTRALPWYESLPEELKNFELLNDYLKNPPAQKVTIRS